jgi:hypothetical protein
VQYSTVLTEQDHNGSRSHDPLSSSILSRTEADELRVARALAIEAYAGVESSLVVLLGRLLGTTNDSAAIVFFRITNTSARNGIIEQLLEQKHGTKYDTYWHGQPGSGGQRRIPGLFALIRQLDSRRNEIVHWHPRQTSSTGDESDDLVPAYYWARAPHLEPITKPDLNEFIAKANFVQRSIFYFNQFTSKAPEVFLRAYGRDLETWTRLFQQPVPYPPAGDHPLTTKPTTT